MLTKEDTEVMLKIPHASLGLESELSDRKGGIRKHTSYRALQRSRRLSSVLY